MTHPSNLEEFGSIRMISALTPNSFSKKIIIISTTWSIVEKLGTTAIKQESGLNYFDIDYNKPPWNELKKHTDYDEAKKFHDEIVSKQKFSDCESI